MPFLDIYESGLGYRALRLETFGDAELSNLAGLFESSASGTIMTANSITLKVAVVDRPPWRIAEELDGLVTWTVSAWQAAEIKRRIENARAHPAGEKLLNEEGEDLVVELVHFP